MNKEELKALIDEKVKTNGKGEITALSLNEVLTAIAENAGGSTPTIKAELNVDMEQMIFEATLLTSQEDIDAIYDIVCNGGLATLVMPMPEGILPVPFVNMIGVCAGVNTTDFLEMIMQFTDEDFDFSKVKSMYFGEYIGFVSNVLVEIDQSAEEVNIQLTDEWHLITN